MKILTITKGVTSEYLHTFTYRFNWFISQIALTTLKYETYGPKISTMRKTDWFVESSHKTEIKSRSVHLNQNTIWTIVWEYTAAKIQYMNGAEYGFVYYTQWSASNLQFILWNYHHIIYKQTPMFQKDTNSGV